MHKAALLTNIGLTLVGCGSVGLPVGFIVLGRGVGGLVGGFVGFGGGVGPGVAAHSSTQG